MDNPKELKIFLVDDDMFSLNVYEKYLRNLGYENITSFSSGTDCLHHLNKEPDVVFLDHNMEDLTGFEVLKKIKRYNPNIYVVIVSGQENMKTAVDSLKFGAFDYLIKGDNETDKISKVLVRIVEIQHLIQKNDKSILKKLLSIF